MRLSALQRESLEEAVSTYEEALETMPLATSYLDERGLDQGARHRFRLGYVASPTVGHDPFVGMLSIPYLTPAGPVAVKFRRLDDQQPKYLGPAGQGARLYNVDALHRSSHEIAICEGEIDAMTLDYGAGIPAVGIDGAQKWQPHYARILSAYERIWIFADNDLKDDGSNPGFDLARTIHRDLPQATLIHLPPNTDVNKLYVEQGAQALQNLIKRDQS